MGRRGQRSERRQRVPPSDGEIERVLGPVPTRGSKQLYNFDARYFAIVAELERLFPDSKPPIDWAAIEPGCESVESVSLQLLGRMLEKFEQSVLLAFCKLNADRILDYIEQRIDQGGWPFNVDETLGEVYARLHHELMEATVEPPKHRPTIGKFLGQRSVFHRLRTEVDQILFERIRHLRSFALPIPGVPLPPLVTADGLNESAKVRLDENECELPEKSLHHWVAHALMAMPAEARRILHLREQRGASIPEIAENLGTTPFEAGRRLQEAKWELLNQVDSLMSAFYGDRVGETIEDGANTTDDHDSSISAEDSPTSVGDTPSSSEQEDEP